MSEFISDRFEIEREAGRGGMGTVYRALDRLSGAPVALKVLTSSGHVEEQRFAREIHVLGELRHRAIVRYVAHGITGLGQRYLVMEWLEGETLAERLRGRGLSIAESVDLARRVAEALDLAHQRGILHRDIKPGNLFLCDGAVDRVKVLDFGVARLREASDELTASGVALGTPGYIAPEQASGRRDADGRADIFSLGCVLFKCLTRETPFAGADALAVMLKMMLEGPRRARQFNLDVPEPLDDLIARMLSRDPAARPSCAALVAAQLSSIDVARSSRAKPAPPALTASERQARSIVLARVWPSSGDASVPSAAAFAVNEGALRAAVTPHGASLSVLQGGVIVATVERGGTATDQAARAARSALALRALLPDAHLALMAARGVMSPRPSMPGRRAQRGGTANRQSDSGAELGGIGGAIDRGVAMLASGACGEIRLDAVAAGLLDARFEIGGGASGLSLLGERDFPNATRLLLGKPTTFVGRDRELDALLWMLDECVTEHVPHAALVVADAGVGKSRLRYEFLLEVAQRYPSVSVWMGRGDPTTAGSPFGLLADALRRALGLHDGASAALCRQKVLARVARQVQDADAARIADFLAELIGAPLSDDEASAELRVARKDALLMGQQIRRAWEEFIADACGSEGLVLVLEDLHWGDLPSVQMVDAALRDLSDRPLMVLATARPEVDRIFPKLWAERALTQMHLGELSRRAAERLVREVLGASADPDIVTTVIDRAAGNAFYLEELIRTVATGNARALPETVLSMIEARLAALTPEERRVLRAASVFGQVFWSGGVAALLGNTEPAALRDVLSTLVDQEFIGPTFSARFPEEEQFVFRHALMRQGAYATLTEPDLVLGNRLAGAWLERAGEHDAHALAEHFELGKEWGRAAECYHRAAEQALAANDFGATLERATRGIACGVAGGLWREERGEEPGQAPMLAEGAHAASFGALRRVQAEAHTYRGELAQAAQRGLDALRYLPHGSTTWLLTAGAAASAAGRLGWYERAAEVATELLTIAPEDLDAAVIAVGRVANALFLVGQMDLGEALLGRMTELERKAAPASPFSIAWIHKARASFTMTRGRPADALLHSRACAEAFDEAGDVRYATLQHNNVGYCLIELGLYAEAERELREGMETANALGMSTLAIAAHQNLGLSLFRRASRRSAP